MLPSCARAFRPTRDSHFNPAHLYLVQVRERCVLRLLQRHGLADLRTTKILEVGCGDGSWLREFVKWGADPANITGIDLDAGRVDAARRRTPAAVTVRCGDAAALPDADGSFDLVLQSTVFTSVLDAGRRAQVAAEMRRVVREHGLIVWYDFHVDNPWNPNVRRVSKRDIRRLFAGCDIRLERITLAPPVARLVAPWSVALCAALEMLPPLRTHYLGSIRPRRSP